MPQPVSLTEPSTASLTATNSSLHWSAPWAPGALIWGVQAAPKEGIANASPWPWSRGGWKAGGLLEAVSLRQLFWKARKEEKGRGEEGSRERRKQENWIAPQIPFSKDFPSQCHSFEAISLGIRNSHIWNEIKKYISKHIQMIFRWFALLNYSCFCSPPLLCII